MTVSADCRKFLRQVQGAISSKGVDSMAAKQHVLTIPTTTLPVGPTTFGPVTVSANVTAVLSVDRTVAGGMNSLTSSSSLTVSIQQSPDGVTWDAPGQEVTWPGGVLTDNHGNPLNADTLDFSGIAAGTTEMRVVCTVGGPSSIVVGGTCTIN